MEGKIVLLAVLLAIVIVQAIVICVLKRKYRQFKKEVDIERRVNYSHH